MLIIIIIIIANISIIRVGSCNQQRSVCEVRERCADETRRGRKMVVVGLFSGLLRRPFTFLLTSLFLVSVFVFIVTSLQLSFKKSDGIFARWPSQPAALGRAGWTAGGSRKEEGGSRLLAAAEAPGGRDSNFESNAAPPTVPERALPLLKVLVLTYNRNQSLHRLLGSLNNAEYDGLPVSIEIHIDRDRQDRVDKDTLTVATAFQFQHGQVQVLVKPRHVGVLGQWLGSWKVPADDQAELAVFLEDDITVSPYFARWLRMVHGRYDGYPSVNGYALQAESIKHASGAKGDLVPPEGQSVFLYPVLGSWGFSPNTRWWRHFLGWYNQISRLTLYVPYVRGLQPSSWYLQLRQKGRADTMWTMWHIDHAYKNRLYTLYGLWPGGQGGAFNWKEGGEHYAEGRLGHAGPAKVLQSWREEDFVLPEELVIVDAKGQDTGLRMTSDEVVSRHQA